jgi:hypothetical protein
LYFENLHFLDVDHRYPILPHPGLAAHWSIQLRKRRLDLSVLMQISGFEL